MSTGIASTRGADIFGTVAVTMVTPFDKDGNLDVRTGVQLAGYLVDDGRDAFTLADTTGGSPTTTVEEKLEFLRAARAEMGDKVKLVVGASINDTAGSIELARASVEAGADALLVVTPYYSKPSQEGLYRHFTAVTDATEASVCLYDIPPRLVIPIEVDTIHRLAEHPRVQAVKDAKGDLGAAAGITANTDLVWYSGDDVLNLPQLSIGATGFISAIGYAAPQLPAEVHSCFDKGDLAGVQATHAKMTPLFVAQAALGGVSFAEPALRLQGIGVGGSCLPQIIANDQRLEVLEEAMRKAGVLQRLKDAIAPAR